MFSCCWLPFVQADLQRRQVRRPSQKRRKSRQINHLASNQIDWNSQVSHLEGRRGRRTHIPLLSLWMQGDPVCWKSVVVDVTKKEALPGVPVSEPCSAKGCKAVVPAGLSAEHQCILHFTLFIEQECTGMRR